MLLTEDPRYRELKRLAAEYQQATGKQGFLYPTHSGGRGEPTRFAFGDHHVCFGINQALTYARALAAEARQQAAEQQTAADEFNEQMKDTT